MRKERGGGPTQNLDIDSTGRIAANLHFAAFNGKRRLSRRRGAADPRGLCVCADLSGRAGRGRGTC